MRKESHLYSGPPFSEEEERGVSRGGFCLLGAVLVTRAGEQLFLGAEAPLPEELAPLRPEGPGRLPEVAPAVFAHRS